MERANETRGVLSTARVTRGRHPVSDSAPFSIGGQKRAFDIVRRIGFDPRRYSADSACSLARGVRTVSTDERRHADPVRLPRTDSNLVMSILHVAARLTRDTLHTLYSAYTALTCVYEYIYLATVEPLWPTRLVLHWLVQARPRATLWEKVNAPLIRSPPVLQLMAEPPQAGSWPRAALFVAKRRVPATCRAPL